MEEVEAEMRQFDREDLRDMIIITVVYWSLVLGVVWFVVP